jgi:hypothetical protein
MKVTTSATSSEVRGVATASFDRRARSRKNLYSLQNVVGTTKLTVFFHELGDPLPGRGRGARPVPRVNLGPVHPQPQRLHTHAEILRHTRDHPMVSPVSRRTSWTIRTARSRNSSGYFCRLRRAPPVVAMLHPRFQGQEHPRIPGRISPPTTATFLKRLIRCIPCAAGSSTALLRWRRGRWRRDCRDEAPPGLLAHRLDVEVGVRWLSVPTGGDPACGAVDLLLSWSGRRDSNSRPSP